MTTATNWLLAIIFGLLVAAACNLDAADDAGTAQSPALIELQSTQAGTARRLAAGKALCVEARGPGSTAHWTADGDLVCRLPTPRPGAANAMQAAL